MIKKYFTKTKESLYQTKILPIINVKDSSQLSLEMIIDGMKPVPYEQIKNQLPTKFAKATRLILERK